MVYLKQLCEKLWLLSRLCNCDFQAAALSFDSRPFPVNDSKESGRLAPHLDAVSVGVGFV